MTFFIWRENVEGCVLKKVLLTVLILTLCSAAALFMWLKSAQFGRPMSPRRAARIAASPNWKNGAFSRVEPAEIITSRSRDGFLTAWWKFFTATYPDLTPSAPIPSRKTDLKSLPRDGDAVVWMGHSSFFLRLNGKNILADPVFSGSCSPLPFVGRAFAGTDVYAPEDMPDIDVLVISHEHWDHLDYKTITALRPRVRNVVCGLGLGEYFEMWGYDAGVIHEGDWHDSFDFDGLTVRVLPAQHYAQRLFARDRTLCSGYAFVTEKRRVFYTGDSGWAKHVKEIGEKYGPFDLVIAENGQYNEDWRHIHMFPEETARAAAEHWRARCLLPVHSGKFTIARHPWYEPFERIDRALSGTSVRLLTPVIGEAVFLDDAERVNDLWWRPLMPARAEARQ